MLKGNHVEYLQMPVTCLVEIAEKDVQPIPTLSAVFEMVPRVGEQVALSRGSFNRSERFRVESILHIAGDAEQSPVMIIRIHSLKYG